METERRLLRLVRPYWGLLAAGLIVTFFASVLDGFVLVVLIPLLKNLFGTAGELHTGPTQLEAFVDRLVQPLVAGLSPTQAAGRLVVWTEASPAGTTRLLRLRPVLRGAIELVRMEAQDREDTLALAHALMRRLGEATGLAIDARCVQTALSSARQYLNSASFPGPVLDLLKLTVARVAKAGGRRVDPHGVIETLAQHALIDVQRRVVLDDTCSEFLFEDLDLPRLDSVAGRQIELVSRRESSRIQGVEAHVPPVGDVEQRPELVPQIDLTGGGRYPVLGASHNLDAATARHDRVAWAYAAGAATRGVHVVQHTPVTGLVRKKDRVDGVETPAGRISAGVVVSAVGGRVTALAPTTTRSAFPRRRTTAGARTRTSSTSTAASPPAARGSRRVSTRRRCLPRSARIGRSAFAPGSSPCSSARRRWSSASTSPS